MSTLNSFHIITEEPMLSDENLWIDVVSFFIQIMKFSRDQFEWIY